MVIKAKINGDGERLLLFAERQPGKSTTKIHVTSVLTKCRKNGRVALEIMNATKSPVRLKQGDKIAELELFQEMKAEVKDKAMTVIRHSDLNIWHLSTEEQQHLCHVLNESRLCPVEETKVEVAVISATNVMSSQKGDEECAEIMSRLRVGDNHPQEDRSEPEGHKNQYVIEDELLYNLWTPVRKGKLIRVRKQLVVQNAGNGEDFCPEPD
eukprot:gene13488-4367_t